MTFIRLFLLFVYTAALPASLSATVPWQTDLAKAQTQARAEGRHVLIHFTGSDWCGWCMKLRKEVFLKPEFAAYANTNLVLVKVDFPKRKPPPPAIQQANQRLAEQFQVQDFPTLVVLNAQGAILGRINYGSGGVKTFLADLEKVIHPPVDIRSAPTPVKTPARPARDSRAGSTNAAVRPELKLSKIAGTKQKRRAVINDRVLSAGQSAQIKLPAGPVKVNCVEVRERSVIITLDGTKERRELRLAGGI